jgi:hypothetical protein
MVHSKLLLSDFKEYLGKVTIGDKAEVNSLEKCTFIGYHIKKDGKEIKEIFHEVLSVPDLWVNLFSNTKQELQIFCKEN